MDIGVSSYMIGLIPVLVLILLVVLVIAFTKRSLPDGTSLLTPRRLVETYVYCVVLVSMLLVSSGIADLLKAGISRRYGIASTYLPQPVWDENRKNNEPPKYEYDERAPGRDLLSGSAQFGVGTLIGILHLLGLRRLGRTEPATASAIYRIFLIAGLIIYTCAVLVYAVGTVQDLLLYRYGGPPVRPDWYNRPIPGEKFAGLSGYLPFWGVLVERLFRFAKLHTELPSAEVS